jgi:hypothetical protein
VLGERRGYKDNGGKVLHFQIQDIRSMADAGRRSSA